MDVAVRAEGLSKTYQIYRRPADRLIEALTRRRRHTSFAALDGVSFEVERGETVGVVGQNGAGKSTLLKILCGVTQPTSGSLHTSGTIASILELGTGFHPEFSGRDNAALNAAILGLNAEQVKRSLPAILEFSELGPFLDRPVKTYSSGMYMRLAFSVAVNVDPDILVVDEALAVGDGHFQKKCTDRIREFQEAGKTILFCSHSLYYVASICRRTLWLDGGRAMAYGPTLDVIHQYETFLRERDRSNPAEPVLAEKSRTPARFRGIAVCDRNGDPRQRFERGDEIRIRMRLESDDPKQPLHVLLTVHRASDDLQCFTVETHGEGIAPLEGSSEYEITVELRDVPLLRGDYTITAFLGDENAITVFDRSELRPAFSMNADRFEVGVIAVDHSWRTSA